MIFSKAATRDSDSTVDLVPPMTSLYQTSCIEQHIHKYKNINDVIIGIVSERFIYIMWTCTQDSCTSLTNMNRNTKEAIQDAKKSTRNEH